MSSESCELCSRDITNDEQDHVCPSCLRELRAERDRLVSQLRTVIAQRNAALNRADAAERGGVATESDLTRARAFFSAWRLVVRHMPEAQADGVQALAQAFADERAPLEEALRVANERLEASAVKLRETIGICSDIAKLMPQISEALDEYAKPPAPVACGVAYRATGEWDYRDPGKAMRACELPQGHAGPHGATR